MCQVGTSIFPFKVKMVEQNLEAFLFIMGATAVTITSKWGLDLIALAMNW